MKRKLKKDETYAHAELIGYSLFIFKNEFIDANFYSLYNTDQEIIGTELILDGVHFQMVNMEKSDFLI